MNQPDPYPDVVLLEERAADIAMMRAVMAAEQRMADEVNRMLTCTSIPAQDPAARASSSLITPGELAVMAGQVPARPAPRIWSNPCRGLTINRGSCLTRLP